MGDRLVEVGLVHLIGQLGDDQRVPAGPLVLLDLDPGPHDHLAAARLVGLADPLLAVDEATSREVRTLDVGQQFVGGDVGVGHQRLDRRGDLAQVVRRDVGGHAHRDAAGAVDQQVGKLRRQHRRLLALVVEIGLVRDGVLVDVLEHRQRDAGQPRLGVAIGRRRVAVDRAEVALPLDQGIAQREVLDHPHQRIVDRLVAVRVVLAEHVANHRRRFLERAIGKQPQLVHRVEDPAMDRLEAVAHVGERARDDHAHGVVDEGLLELVLDQARDDPFAGNGRGHRDPGFRKDLPAPASARGTLKYSPDKGGKPIRKPASKTLPDKWLRVKGEG